MTIRDQIPSNQTKKAKTQTKKQKQQTKSKQTDETNLKRPNASDEDQVGLAE